jgi:hypothetical protein
MMQDESSNSNFANQFNKFRSSFALNKVNQNSQGVKKVSTLEKNFQVKYYNL